MKRKILFSLFLSLVLIGCGDKYPELAMYPKAIHSDVYSINANILEVIKKDVLTSEEINKATTNDIIYWHANIREKNKQNQVTSSVFWFKEITDIKRYIQEQKDFISKNIKLLQDEVIILSSQLEKLTELKQKAQSASAKLKILENELSARQHAEHERYNELNSSYFKMFTPFTARPIGTEYIEERNGYGLHMFYSDRIRKNQCQDENVLYGKVVQLHQYQYCTYFTPRLKKTQAKALFKSLTNIEKDQLKELAYLSFVEKNKRKIHRDNHDSLLNKNVDIVKTSQSFTRSHDRKLKFVRNKISDVKSSITKMKTVNDEDIRNSFLSTAKREFFMVKERYNLEVTFSHLNKVAKVQADGTIIIPDNIENFIIYRPNSKKNQFKLVRLSHYKDQPSLLLNDDHLLSIDALLTLNL